MLIHSVVVVLSLAQSSSPRLNPYSPMEHNIRKWAFGTWSHNDAKYSAIRGKIDGMNAESLVAEYKKLLIVSEASPAGQTRQKFIPMTKEDTFKWMVLRQRLRFVNPEMQENLEKNTPRAFRIRASVNVNFHPESQEYTRAQYLECGIFCIPVRELQPLARKLMLRYSLDWLIKVCHLNSLSPHVYPEDKQEGDKLAISLKNVRPKFWTIEKQLGVYYAKRYSSSKRKVDKDQATEYFLSAKRLIAGPTEHAKIDRCLKELDR